jgi:hypothetical protein
MLSCLKYHLKVVATDETLTSKYVGDLTSQELEELYYFSLLQ